MNISAHQQFMLIKSKKACKWHENKSGLKCNVRHFKHTFSNILYCAMGNPFGKTTHFNSQSASNYAKSGICRYSTDMQIQISKKIYKMSS